MIHKDILIFTTLTVIQWLVSFAAVVTEKDESMLYWMSKQRTDKDCIYIRLVYMYMYNVIKLATAVLHQLRKTLKTFLSYRIFQPYRGIFSA